MPLFRIFFWCHRVLLIGPAFDTAPHVHHAAQWCFGLEAPLRVRSPSDAHWKQHQSFYVPTSVPHELQSTRGCTAFLYLEPTSFEMVEARGLLAHPEVISPMAPYPADLARLSKLTEPTATIEEADAVCRDLLGLSGGNSSPVHRSSPVALTPRMARCVREIEQGLPEPLRLSALADRLRVSESCLMHQFTTELGIPIRRYILWQRLRRATLIALQGASLTEAAHAAGLSDGAHLSRTFKSAFGVTPSLLFAHRQQVVASFDGDRPDEIRTVPASA